MAVEGTRETVFLDTTPDVTDLIRTTAATTATTGGAQNSGFDDLNTAGAATGVTGSGRLQFPSDYNTEAAQWLMFSRYAYERPNAFTAPNATRIGNIICLPMPPNFNTAYGAQWENIDLGLLGNITADIGGKVAKKLFNDGNRHAGGWGHVVDTIGAGGSEILRRLPDLGKAFLIDRVFDDVIKRGGYAAGLARNPFAAIVFTGMQFRTFSFDWKLVPRSKAEADTIRSIIKEFKTGMHPELQPGYENNLFKYPDLWQIQITKDDYMFKIGQTVLKDVAINYHGEGQAAYFKEKIPFAITLQVQFQEVVILLKDDIANGF